MTVEMLNGFFEIIQGCDRTEAMILAAAALEQANKLYRGTNRCSTQEEFVRWFKQTAGLFGSRTMLESGSPQHQAAFENERMGMSAG